MSALFISSIFCQYFFFFLFNGRKQLGKNCSFVSWCEKKSGGHFPVTWSSLTKFSICVLQLTICWCRHFFIFFYWVEKWILFLRIFTTEIYHSFLLGLDREIFWFCVEFHFRMQVIRFSSSIKKVKRINEREKERKWRSKRWFWE